MRQFMKEDNTENLSYRILKILSLFIIMFIPIRISHYLPGYTDITEADVNLHTASEVIKAFEDVNLYISSQVIKFYNEVSDNLILLTVLLTFIFLPQIDVQRTRKNLFGK